MISPPNPRFLHAARRAVVAALAIVVASPAAVVHADAGARPQRIVSLNLCSDQLLLALADRSQIAGLTHNARDPSLSAAAAEVGNLPVLKQSAEQILVIRPDLVIGMPTKRSAVMAALGGEGYRTLDLQSARTFPQIAEQIGQVADAIGQPQRGAALVRRMEAELARLPKPGRGQVAAYYQRRGFLTGTGTLIDDLMQRVGLVNLAARLGKPPLSQLSIEELVAAKPDFLIVDSGTAEVEDQGTEMLHHPALAGIPRLSLPQAWTVCSGPAYVDAARLLVAELQRY